jgi:hypothetical protein
MSQPLFRSLPDPRDPDRVAVVLGDVEVGRFALRGLLDHGAGRKLAAAIGGPRQARFPGPHGIVHDVTIACDRELAHVEAVFAAIARRSLARLYGAVFFCGGDLRQLGVLRALGVELPAELAATDLAPVIGVFEPARVENLARLRALELGRAFALAA